MSDRRSHLESRFAARSLKGLGILAAVVLLSAVAWAAVWSGSSTRLRSEVDAYTRQEALTLARTLLYDLAADRRLGAIRDFQDLKENLPDGGPEPSRDLVDLLERNPSIPDALIWEAARKRGLKVEVGDVAVARRQLYTLNIRRYADELEEDLWARVTLSDHLRAVRVTSQYGGVEIAAGEVPEGIDPSKAWPPGQVKPERRGLLAVRLPLHIGLHRWGEVWCLLDRSAVTSVARHIRASVRFGNLVLAGAAALLFAALVGLWYILQRSLREEVVAPVVRLARRMEAWEQERPPEETARSETEWLSDAFDRLLGRVRLLLAQRDTAMERVQSQQETLLKAERLGLLERMGAGLSHELNNALNPAWLRLEEIRIGGRPPDTEDLDALRGHIQSARAILKDLGSATRRSPAAMRPVEAGEWLGVALRLVEPHFHSGPALDARVPEDLPPVLGDPQLLIQCMVNLLLNARDAASLRKEGGGRVTVGAKAQEGWLVVRVEDDGPGVPPDLRKRLFEPFVSTKSHGTGLGLFFVDSAMKGMGGQVRLAEEAREVTRFEMFLPLAGFGGLKDGGMGESHGG